MHVEGTGAGSPAPFAYPEHGLWPFCRLHADLERLVTDHRITSEKHPKPDLPTDVAELHRHGLAQTLFGHPAQRTHLTKSERAYAAVRRAIVTHSLPPSVPLDEHSLLAQFPYGRTPLREALKRLSHEHLLVWPPHQAPMVRDIGLYDLPHLYETRELLETRVAELAAERATPEDLEQLNDIRGRLSHATENGFIYEAVELDYALHAAIARTTRNRYLTEASNLLNLQSLRLWYRAHNELGVNRVGRMHRDLVDAIESHDQVAARDIATAHVHSSRERQQQLLLNPGGEPDTRRA